MRLIYSGTGSPEVSGEGTQIGTSIFDNYYNSIFLSNSTILGESSSFDETTLYGWYNSKIKLNYEKLIVEDAKFCNDSESVSDSFPDVGSVTFYGARLRYYDGLNIRVTFTPTLKCNNISDKLQLPVGLITADEYMLAGGGIKEAGYYNTAFWLHTGEDYWTMSPSVYNYYNYYNYYMLILNSDGYLNDSGYINTAYGVRPVINLKSTTTFESNGADGSSLKPYEVKI